MRNRLWRKGIWLVLPALLFARSFPVFADSSSVVGISDTLAAEGKTGEALALLDRSLGQSPSDPALLTAKANVLLRARVYEETANICRQIIAKDPNYDWPVKILVRSLLDQRRYQEALKELAQAGSFIQEDYTLAILEGEALQGLRRYREAAEAFDRAALMKPDDINLHEIKAWNLRLMGKMQDSEKELKKALSLKPYNQRLLVALANHYRERRYYRKSLDYLKEAINACGRSSCPEIDKIYKKDFFYGTGISGLQLFSGGGLGVSSAIRNEYTGEFSNVENILRGLRSQNANAAEEDTLAVPRMTPQNILQSVAHIRLPKFPLIHFYSNYNQRFNKRDPSVEHLNHEYRLELEETLRVPRMGDVTFFPYYKYLYTRGANFDVQDLLGSDFKINVHSFGLRNLFIPVFGKYLIETEYSYGLGYYRHNVNRFHENRFRVKGTRLFSDSSFVSLDNDFYFMQQKKAPKNSEMRYCGTLLFEKFLSKHFRGIIEQQLIVHEDYIVDAKDLSTIIWKPMAGMNVLLADPLQWRTKIGYFIGNVFHVYDHFTFSSELNYRFNTLHTKKINGYRLPYDMPVDLVVGYKSEGYARYPRAKNKWLQTIYASCNLFW